MRIGKWMLALIALLACGLIAAGCGDDDDSSSSSSSTTSTSSDSGSSGSSSEDVLKACQDAIAGTAAEAAGEQGCQAAADAFAKCAEEADKLSESAAKDTAVQACQKTADAAVAALKSAG
jgi:hypothetical protein